jgi:hypothetical protein
MISPARMKKGIARRVNMSKPEKYWRGAIDRREVFRELRYRPTMPAIPRVKPMGTPSMRRVKNTTVTAMIMVNP